MCNDNSPYKAAFNYNKADKLHKNQYQVAKALLSNLFVMARIGGPAVVKPLLPVIQDIEFAMQEACGLPKDDKKHRWWMEIPGCTCPKYDNMDLFGTGLRIYSEDCPYHGHLYTDDVDIEKAIQMSKDKILLEFDEDNEYGF